MEPHTAVCLPVISHTHKLVWVLSERIDLQFEGAAELEKAFDGFPYLTRKETAALAKRCSLHVDKVRVWFMLQRLRYGISWDYKDIQEIQRKFRPGQKKKDMQNKMGQGTENDQIKKRKNRERNKSDKRIARKVSVEKSENEETVTGGKVRTKRQLERKMKQEQSVKEEDVKVKVEIKKRRNQVKRKRITVGDKTRKKRMNQVGEGVGERAGDSEIRSDQDVPERKNTMRSETTEPAGRIFVSSEEPPDVIPMLLLQHQAEALNVPPPDTLSEQMQRYDILPAIPGSSCLEEKPEARFVQEEEPPKDLENHNFALTDFSKLMDLIETDDSVGLPISTPQQDSQTGDSCALSSQIHSSVKTPYQVMIMREAFSHCQYPDSEYYTRLAKETGVPRCGLVQWFGDMRYYVKKGKPRWMTENQHRQALANIKYQQCLNAKNAALKTLERSESCDEKESLKVSPECK